jgi:hypothetical protein
LTIVEHLENDEIANEDTADIVFTVSNEQQ